MPTPHQGFALARAAMATRFEILFPDGNSSALRAAGEAALDEVDRLESLLSLYLPTSEIARVNTNAAQHPVRVSPEVFTLLQHAQKISQETAGAFDLTAAPLIKCWGFMNRAGEIPAPAVLAQARALVGHEHVILDATQSTVSFDRPGVMLDLGAIGKGYAVDAMAKILREAGISRAVIHSGSSTTYALGHPPNESHWHVAIASPPDAGGEATPLRRVPLKNESLSVSAIWGRSFQSHGQIFGHVIDPRTGQPVSNPVLSAIVLPSATETDAFSTAMLVAGQAFPQLRPNARTLLVKRDSAQKDAYFFEGNL